MVNMSSSLSLTISSQDDIASDQLQVGPTAETKRTRTKPNLNETFTTVKGTKLYRQQGQPNANNFYEEVDERMSRNSLEYPEQQANYIEDWLDLLGNKQSEPYFANYNDNDENEYGGKEESKEKTELRGNVIGIKGFNVRRDLREKQNELSIEYRKLRAKYNQLLKQFMHKLTNQTDDGSGGTRHQYQPQDNHHHHREQQRIGEIKLLVESRQQDGNQHHDHQHSYCQCSGNHKESICDLCSSYARLKVAKERREALQAEVDQLRLESDRRDAEHRSKLSQLNECNKELARILREKSKEAEKLKRNIANLQFEPQMRQLAELQRENSHLTQINSLNQEELSKLNRSYAELEIRLKGAIDGQQINEKELNVQESNLLAEQYQLQVEQHKLEQILSTEQEIEHELREKIEKLIQEKNKTKLLIKEENKSLQRAKERLQFGESIQLDQLSKNLAHLRERHKRLTDERSVQQDALENCQKRHRELEERLEKIRTDLEKKQAIKMAELGHTTDSVKLDRENLVSQIDELHEKLAISQGENDKLISQIQQMELVIYSLKEKKSATKHEAINDDRLANLRAELSNKEQLGEELRFKISSLEHDLEMAHKQYDELKRRYDLQAETINDISARKDKEVSKLRIDLNYERYNRQVAIRTLERELRASLKELEIMKLQFTRVGMGGNSATLSNRKNYIYKHINNTNHDTMNSGCKSDNNNNLFCHRKLERRLGGAGSSNRAENDSVQIETTPLAVAAGPSSMVHGYNNTTRSGPQT